MRIASAPIGLAGKGAAEKNRAQHITYKICILEQHKNSKNSMGIGRYYERGRKVWVGEVE
jgi:hypothetical protein